MRRLKRARFCKKLVQLYRNNMPTGNNARRLKPPATSILATAADDDDAVDEVPDEVAVLLLLDVSLVKPVCVVSVAVTPDPLTHCCGQSIVDPSTKLTAAH